MYNKVYRHKTVWSSSMCWITLLFLFSAGISFPLFPQTSPVKTITKTIDAKRPWESSQGIQVKKGQLIDITATGSWTTKPVENGGWGFCGPDGFPPGVKAPNCSLRAKILSANRNDLFWVGSAKRICVEYTGLLLFGHGDQPQYLSDNQGAMVVTCKLYPPPVFINLPGTPGQPAVNAQVQGLPKDIDGPRIVEEDSSNTWYTRGNREVMLVPEKPLTYTFTFGDPYDTAPFVKTLSMIGQSTLSPSQLCADHKYKESGALYKINLSIQCHERVIQPDFTFIDQATTFTAGPFPVIVVDHLPAFIGAALFLIKGPDNTTGRLPETDEMQVQSLVFEDLAAPGAQFVLTSMIKPYTELPPGIDTAVKPDRFSGVDPQSVSFQVDFGDGSPRSDWLEIPGLKTANPNSIDQVDHVITSQTSFAHRYAIPGIYTITVYCRLRMVLYKEQSYNGVTYTYTREQGPLNVSSYSHIVKVCDRTPPRYSPEILGPLSGTTGDPAVFEFLVEDNHPDKNMTRAELKIELPAQSGSYVSLPLDIQYIGKAPDSGRCYKLTSKSGQKWPDSFACKSSDPAESFSYHLELVDHDGNLNPGCAGITEDTPPEYGIITGQMDTGKFLLYDNDPPSAVMKISQGNLLITQVIVTEKKSDFEAGPGIYGQILIEEPDRKINFTAPDPAVNPVSSKTDENSSIVLPENFTLRLREDERFRIEIKTTDNVDPGAATIEWGIADPLHQVETAEVDSFDLVSTPGKHEFQIRLRDMKNSNGTWNYRLFKFPAVIENTKMNRTQLTRD